MSLTKRLNHFLTFRAGEIVNARYQIIEKLGSGSLGTVYSATDLHVGNTVAIKFMSSDVRQDKAKGARLSQEIRTAYSIRSEYVTSLYEIFIEEHHIGLVLEFVNGRSLLAELSSGRVFAIREVVNLGRQLSLGLQTIHDAGIIHRDIKLENVLLSEDQIVKITDFGISILRAAVSESDLDSSQIDRTERLKRATDNGGLVGTLHYLAPEYLLHGKFDERVDVYAMGIVIYELVTSSYPFECTTVHELIDRKLRCPPPSPREKRSECPEWLERLVLRAMHSDPGQRFQSAYEVYRELSHELRNLPIQPTSTKQLEVELRRNLINEMIDAPIPGYKFIVTPIYRFIRGVSESLSNTQLVPDSQFRVVVLFILLSAFLGSLLIRLDMADLVKGWREERKVNPVMGESKDVRFITPKIPDGVEVIRDR